ncbi:calcium-activated chloride channel regulator 1-like [Daphnia carinata]|uniref:calcium-activated chloride channel regulator 1-like n=1 Tax=Daphnia carinata TaxID=120202 RepID=UPI00257C3CBC|nr:calcium-activated chloride channel regulator 1-like [Daphnia carinata]
MITRCVCIVLLTILIFNVDPTHSTTISLNQNAYSNIVVAISPDVPNTWSETILQNIQLMIRRASSVLYRATKKRAYFKDVRILIPESWSNVQSNISTWETYSEADVRVAPAALVHGDKPYTIQSGGCGQPGEYIHLTPDYLRTLTNANNTSVFGPPEKVFVHEWSHLRYGVFDEFGHQNDKKLPLFYKPPNSEEILPNLCTNKQPIFTTKDVVTQGPCRIDPTTGVYNSDCVYNLLPQFVPDTSLMSDYSVDSVVDFCENDQDLAHAFKAPNKHNAMCGSRSVWAVITRHPDFAMNNNPPSDILSIEPTFQIVRSGGSRFVLVADTSGSMNNYSRILRLYETSRRWIKYDISDGSKLGLVQFSHNAIVTSPIVEINGDASREALIAPLPVNAVGATCIGCGLLKALELLAPGGPGGVILLLTDGEETDKPFISNVLPELVRSSARVVSIAFGRTAEDKIENLADKTNGKSYFIDDNDPSQGLNDAFVGSLTYQPAVSAYQIIVTLLNRQYQNVAGDAINDHFSVDSTVGRNLIFRVDYTQKSHLKSFSLKSPNGTVYTQFAYDDGVKVAMFKLPEAEVGTWYFTLTVSSSIMESLAVQVTSQTRSTTIAPIKTECSVLDGDTFDNAKASPVRILAKVMQDSNAVVQAKVKAHIEMPSGQSQILELLDNGVSADTLADDGIYSRFFVGATSGGRYTVECEVWDDDSAYVNDGTFVRHRQKRSTTSRMTGAFTRRASGGSFKITQSAAVGADIYPPSRITDLFIVEVRTNPDMTATIQFTAPGEDLDSGTAASYEIRYSPVFDDLRETNFDSANSSTLVQQEHVVNGSLQPMVSGSQQIITFVVMMKSEDTRTYYIALRATDASGQAALPSNIVTAQFPLNESASSLSTIAIIGIIVGCLLGLLLIAAIPYLVHRKKYLSYKAADTQSKP